MVSRSSKQDLRCQEIFAETVGKRLPMLLSNSKPSNSPSKKVRFKRKSVSLSASKDLISCEPVCLLALYPVGIWLVIIFVLGYSIYFFKLAGLDTSQAFDLGVGVTACGVFGNFVSWFIVTSTFGRRKTFNYGMTVLTVLLLMIGIMDVIPPELLNGARTTALATATQAIFGIVMNFAIPYMVNPNEANSKGKVGFVFGGLALIGTVGSFLYVPELKGHTFGEIDTMFFRHAAWKMGSYQID
ncbi:hypothetical protein V1525DRAFT_391935 [Lipomyces kononenkoae]|uniref:Uncharacterized protein n=1 Tax=Lipomyces kononenkoae TaxID=34357 RepID=A0ACC3SRF5_LIPKO